MIFLFFGTSLALLEAELQHFKEIGDGLVARERQRLPKNLILGQKIMTDIAHFPRPGQNYPDVDIILGFVLKVRWYAHNKKNIHTCQSQSPPHNSEKSMRRQ